MLDHNLEAKLTKEFLKAAQQCKKIGYNPGRFLQMLEQQGSVATSVQLVMARDYHEGFTKLWELKRLDLTVEAIIQQEPFNNLFAQEVIERAKQKLKEVEFVV